MNQMQKFSDTRLDGICAYCGAIPSTRDHVPSKILLDSPFPENLPVVESCDSCNQSFSKDEEYFACLIECILVGSTDPKMITRSKIQSILKKRILLRSRIEESRSVVGQETLFKIENDRLENVILKLARGHARFENSELMIQPPTYINYKPAHLLTPEESNDFYSSTPDVFPEVGSRGMFRMIQDESVDMNMWIIVQENNYMYSVTCQNGSLIVKFLVRNYLACTVIWED